MEEKKNDQDPKAVEIERETLIYGVEDDPNPILWPLFALQQIFVCIGGIIATSTLMTIQLGAREKPEVRTQILGISLFSSGMATVLQNIVGSRLPLVFGSVASLIPAMAAVLSLDQWSDDNLLDEIRRNNDTLANEPWKMRMREMQGNLMLAAATQMLMGVTGILGFLLRFIGPLTVAPTITVTGFYIGQFVMPLCEEHWGIAALSIVLLTLFVLLLSKVRLPVPSCSRTGCSVTRVPVFALTSLMFAICIMWLLSYVLTITDVFPTNATMPGHKARTDIRTDAPSASPWFNFPLPFQYAVSGVNFVGYFGILSTIFAGMIKCTGDFILSSRVAEVVPPPPHAVNRGIAVYGLSMTLGAMIGDLSIASPYSQNTGAIRVTKVASRKVFVTAGVLLMVAGVVGKVGAVFTIIPDPIIGGVTIVVMGLVASSGLATLQHVDVNSSRNLLIIGLAMMLGIRVPDWMSSNPGAIKTGNAEFDQISTVLLSNPMFLSGFIGCLLDNLVPGTEKERGIKRWREILQSPSSKSAAGKGTYELPYITDLLRKLKMCSFFPISPTYDGDRTCRPCFSRTKESSYSLNNNAFELDIS